MTVSFVPALTGDRLSFDAFVEAWETGMLPITDWTHAAHVAIGACYAVRYRTDALEWMRSGILHFNAVKGIANTDHSGYHETLTRFWVGVFQQAVAGFDDPWLAACHCVAQFGGRRDLFQDYYSFDVVRSVDARRGWVAPDVSAPPPAGTTRPAE